MRITKDQMIAGVNAIQLRNAFKRRDYWTVEILAAQFPGRDGAGLLEDLMALGYLERDGDADGEPVYQTTGRALTLVAASARKPIKRATAEKLLGEFLSRVAEVNANDAYLYTVTKVIAFGSLLTDSPTLGDLDLAVELRPRISDGQAMTKATLVYANSAAERGRRFSSFVAKLTWATEDVLLALKNGSPSISLHSTSDGILDTADQRVIFVC